MAYLARSGWGFRLDARRSYGRWLVAALAAASIALLVYGSLTRNWGIGPASITSKLPDARSTSAAVQNLPPPNLLKPVTPEEATKENAERPFVARPDTPASKFVLKASADDRGRAITCLTQAIYYEAASEGLDGGRAVAQVVLNRVRHPGYPASVCGVVYEGSGRPTGCQFTFTCDGSLLRPHVETLWARSQKIAKDALSGHVFGPVGHATHYHADYVLPYWADSLDKTVQIGRHIFYRLKGSVGDGRSFFQRYAGSEPPIPEPKPATAGAPVATEAEQQELAKVLIGEDSKGTAPEVEKIAGSSVPLTADARAGTLIIGSVAPATPAHKRAVSDECQPGGDSKKVSGLQANDLHSTVRSSQC